MALHLSSPEFRDGTPIPARFTCEGDDLPPPLHWEGEPEGTKSFALVVEDPDAPDPRHPQRTFSHWVLYNLPPDMHTLTEAMHRGKLPEGAREGLNDWNRPGYGGPCPPIGRHRYVHRLYALDTELPDLGTPTRDELLRAMEGHILAESELLGTYEKRH